MACLLQKITSMKLQNNWYVWQINLHQSSSYLVAHTTVRPVQRPPFISVSCYGLSDFASFLDGHPASTLSFSTVCLHVVFGFLRRLFLSGAQVIVMLQSLFWSCLSILSNHLQSLLLQLFTKRFHVCSF